MVAGSGGSATGNSCARDLNGTGSPSTPPNASNTPSARVRKVLRHRCAGSALRAAGVAKSARRQPNHLDSEGEKKVERIRELGFPAACNAGRAKKWEPEHTAYLKGADVVLLPDNDPVGVEHMEAIAKSLSTVAKRVRILNLPNITVVIFCWHILLISESHGSP